jgi:hypothetical protein
MCRETPLSSKTSGYILHQHINSLRPLGANIVDFLIEIAGLARYDKKAMASNVKFNL